MIQLSSWGHTSSLCSAFTASCQGCSAWQSLCSKDRRRIQSSWRTGPRGRASHPAWGPCPALQAPREPRRCPRPSPGRALPDRPRRAAAPCPEGQAGVFATLGCTKDRALIPRASPAPTHLRPFQQLETPQPFGWLLAPQPGAALGAQPCPAHPEQQRRGREGRGAAALTYPAVRPPYVL